ACSTRPFHPEHAALLAGPRDPRGRVDTACHRTDMTNRLLIVAAIVLSGRVAAGQTPTGQTTTDQTSTTRPTTSPQAASQTAAVGPPRGPLVGEFVGILMCVDCNAVRAKLTLYATSPLTSSDGTYLFEQSYFSGHRIEQTLTFGQWRA